MNLDILYQILAVVATNRSQITYSKLSQLYSDRTQEWHEPHGSWDEPLGELNRTLHETGWPPLSAVVVLKESGEPGGLFWGSSPNVPERSVDGIERIAAYSQILGTVHDSAWPEEIPVAPQQ